ncbi:hypothetical protein WG66_007381, partial [Moniliophthora roreri]
HNPQPLRPHFLKEKNNKSLVFPKSKFSNLLQLPRSDSHPFLTSKCSSRTRYLTAVYATAFFR